MPKGVLLGFSGGIDSTVSARKLMAEGWEVRLVWLKTDSDPEIEARVVAAAGDLGLPLVIDDVREKFENEVIDYFVSGYVLGQTPAPCTVCNTRIKWRRLYELSVELNVAHIATGHYCRIREMNGVYYVVRAADGIKDQSYYLWNLPQSYLAKAVMPMGEVLKKEIMEQWRGADRPAESMSVCFLKGCRYGEFLRTHGVSVTEGDVVDKSGNVVGKHNGYVLYTIGQKRGFDAPPGMCVVGIDAWNNRLVVGKDEELYSDCLVVRDWYSVDIDRLLSCRNLSVVIRGYGRNPFGKATAEEKDGMLFVSLSEPAWAAAKGQPVVFYEGDVVLGGGFLENYF